MDTVTEILTTKQKKTNPDKEAFDISRAINEIFRHIKQLTKKSE